MNIDTIKAILKKRNHKKLLKPKEKEIMDLVPFAETFEEALFCIKNNIKEQPICPYPNCQEKIPHRCYSGLGFYPKGCCENHTKKLNNLEKYNVENVSQLDEIKKKKEATTFKNYGVSNPKQSKEISEKIKNTMERKYGGFGTKGILKDKIEQTCLERFGSTNPMKSIKNQKTLTKTLFDKIVERVSSYVEPNFTFEEYQGSSAKQEWKCINCSTIFEGKIDDGSIPRCPVCFPNQKRSYGEIDLFNFIDIPDKIQSDWTVLGKQELDIFIPSKNLAIEFNGIYWHSEARGKDENYHLNKTIKCEEKGIELIHVFETEWNEKLEIIKSIINKKLGNFKTTISSEDCEINEIDSETKNLFLEENHLQGEVESSINLGLFYKDNLVSVIAFNKIENNYSLERFIDKINYNVVNSLESLFNYFVLEYKPQKVILYLDRRFPDSSKYEKIGFKKTETNPPNFFIINKSKIEKFNSKLAWESFKLNGYDRIWDCGNCKFEWINKKP